jgi:hypothetical protein
LKIPFTVFSIKQKKSILKWLEDICGTGVNASGTHESLELSQILSLVDLNDDCKLFVTNA